MTADALAQRNLLTDNPALYEAQFPDPEHRAARFVHDLVQRYAAEPGGARLLDLGCGTGRDAGWWSRHGYDVVGLDSSEAMLEHARAHHPEARFVGGDLRDWDLGETFDVLTCLDSAMLYCHTNDELVSFLHASARQLVPGGLLVAEMRNGAYYLGPTDLLDGHRTRDLHWQGTTWTSTTTLYVDHAEQLLRRRRSWQTTGQPEPMVQESAWRLLFPQELRAFLDWTGWELVALFDTPGPRTEPAVEAADAAPVSTAMTGDRLHLVVRRLPTTATGPAAH